MTAETVDLAVTVRLVNNASLTVCRSSSLSVAVKIDASDAVIVVRSVALEARL